MPSPVSDHGHEISGVFSTNKTIQTADAGETFFDTATNQMYVCQGAGVWQPLGGSGNVAAGNAGSVRSITKLLTAVADATFTTAVTVTVPNAISGAGFRVNVVGILGDGDSAQMTQFHGSLSRIAGAATGVTFGAAITPGTNNGATANAAVAIQATAMVGAVGAVQTFTIQLKVTRSAGAAANHVLVATIELLNGFASGVTMV